MDNFQSEAAGGDGDCGYYRSDGQAIHSTSSPPSLALEHTAHDDIRFAKMHLAHEQLECGRSHFCQ